MPKLARTDVRRVNGSRVDVDFADHRNPLKVTATAVVTYKYDPVASSWKPAAVTFAHTDEVTPDVILALTARQIIDSTRLVNREQDNPVVYRQKQRDARAVRAEQVANFVA